MKSQGTCLTLSTSESICRTQRTQSSGAHQKRNTQRQTPEQHRLPWARPEAGTGGLPSQEMHWPSRTSISHTSSHKPHSHCKPHLRCPRRTPRTGRTGRTQNGEDRVTSGHQRGNDVLPQAGTMHSQDHQAWAQVLLGGGRAVHCQGGLRKSRGGHHDKKRTKMQGCLRQEPNGRPPTRGAEKASSVPGSPWWEQGRGRRQGGWWSHSGRHTGGAVQGPAWHGGTCL